MIKARSAAGDPWLGGAFVEGVTPFVYPGELPAYAIDEVRRTKVRLEEYIRRRGKEFIEVKRGRGGIRDVEFAIQLLQIVHGRRDPRLRDPNTLRALGTLAEEGYVARPTPRRSPAPTLPAPLEHRLQIVRDLQTHELPATAARTTSRVRSAWTAPGAAGRVRAHDRTRAGPHERLFYRPLLEAFAGPGAPRPGIDRAATEELLAGLGFAAPAPFAVLGGSSTRPRGWARCSSTCSP